MELKPIAPFLKQIGQTTGPNNTDKTDGGTAQPVHMRRTRKHTLLVEVPWQALGSPGGNSGGHLMPT
eukprot:5400442-Alexandrium_andersonii.AAC.1